MGSLRCQVFLGYLHILGIFARIQVYFRVKSWAKVLPSRQCSNWIHAQAYTTERLPTGFVLLLQQLHVFISGKLELRYILGFATTMGIFRRYQVFFRGHYFFEPLAPLSVYARSPLPGPLPKMSFCFIFWAGLMTAESTNFGCFYFPDGVCIFHFALMTTAYYWQQASAIFIVKGVQIWRLLLPRGLVENNTKCKRNLINCVNCYSSWFLLICR